MAGLAARSLVPAAGCCDGRLVVGAARRPTLRPLLTSPGPSVRERHPSWRTLSQLSRSRGLRVSDEPPRTAGRRVLRRDHRPLAPARGTAGTDRRTVGGG